MNERDALLTTAEVADLYQVSPATVRRWYREGVLPGVRNPGGGNIRFARHVIEDALGNTGCVPPDEEGDTPAGDEPVEDALNVPDGRVSELPPAGTPTVP